ncbi:MAG: hypothetical protein ABI672_18845 [Vicinamibacteria bacterium]
MNESHLSIERVARFIAWLAVFLIPVRILGLGYLPPDDALRHAAKAVTNRTWQDILVMRPEVVVDSHPGWHAFLGVFHRLFDAHPADLVFVSVIVLFAALLGSALASSKTHAWALATLVVIVCDSNTQLRWLLGRPFLLSCAVVLILCLRWSRGVLPRVVDVPWMVAMFTLVVWFHPSYYLWSLPVAALIISGWRREAIILGGSVAVGTLAASLLTGSPFAFLKQNLMHPVWSFDWPIAQLVTEFQPAPGAPILFAAVLAVFLSGRATRPGVRASDPVFVLAFLCWGLGFVSARFWLDWGLPATLAWGIRVAEDALSDLPEDLAGKLAIAVTFACALTLCADDTSRWSRVDTTYRTLADPAQAGALPDPGGVLYSDDHSVFYQVFFRKPDAPFRYVLGFEKGLMRPEDGMALRNFSSRQEGFALWAARMTPADRLIVHVANPGTVYGLEWTHVAGDLWSGRTPRSLLQTAPAREPKTP